MEFTLECCWQVIQHGACLGLGLAALGTADEDIFDDIKSALYTDSAVAGEAAGISMGLLMVGTASEKTSEMLAYAHDTQHEKIIRLIWFHFRILAEPSAFIFNSVVYKILHML
jgi:hypothetical protein